MDNPGTSLFQGADIKINNSQNYEEDEDLADRVRRGEELKDLLMNALDEYNYEDSTINSSTNISMVSMDGLQKNYKEAQTPSDQLQVLYEVRMRELNNLRQEFEKYKIESNKENESLKNKLILFEADTRQVKISLKNAEELLVEKADIIKKMNENLCEYHNKVESYEKTIESLNKDICVYTSTISELQLKLQGPNALFNANNIINNDEQHKLLQDRIVKLECSLEEQVKKANILEKENKTLEKDLNQIIEEKHSIENDYKEHTSSLSKTLESAQQQCKDLINVIEMLQTENEHFKNRQNEENVNTSILSESFKNNSLDNATLLKHLEKLKKILLDKAVQIDTYKSKLRHYENDLKELLEYRQLKADVYKKDFEQCNNSSHTKDLLLLQNDIQNYRRTIDDKNQQILNLNSINKELQGKIEEMLLQTRTEIQNLSQKYSLPQLEVMSEELKKTEEKVQELTEKLEKSEQRRLSLVQKVKNKSFEERESALQHELEKYKVRIDETTKIFENEKIKYENRIAGLENELDEASRRVLELQNKVDDKKNDFDDQFINEQYSSLQNKLKELEETVQELNNAKILAEGEVCSTKIQIKEYEIQLEDCKKVIHKLESQLDSFRNRETAEVERIKMYENEKNEMNKILCEYKKQIEDLQNNVAALQNELSDAKEKLTKRKLENDLKVVEHELRHSTSNVQQSEIFKKALQAECLKNELKLRDEICEEFGKKVKEIEKKYQKACMQANEMCKQKSEKIESLELKYRTQFMKVIEDCTETVGALEREKKELVRQIMLLKKEFDEFKIHSVANENKYKELLVKLEAHSEKNIKAWQNWSKQFVTSCLNIEATNKVVRDKILTKMQEADDEVAAIEKKYNSKLAKHHVKNGKQTH